MAIELSEQAKKRSIASIKRYFEEKMEEEIGDLQAGLLLDYFLKEIGPAVYNRAITDAQSYFQEKTGDLDGSHHEAQFGYWK